MNKVLCIFLTLVILIISNVSALEEEKFNGEIKMKFGMQVEMTANNGKGKELAEIMLQASKVVSDLKGCEIYIVQVSTSQEDVVLITEVWQTKEDHQASLMSPEVRELIGKARPLISGMVHHTAQPLGGKGL